VRQIYDTVVEELQKREDRKFIIVEMAFFTMWWNEATEEQKNLVFDYVNKGKVEFVLGLEFPFPFLFLFCFPL